MDTLQADNLFEEADRFYLEENYAESLARLDKLDASFPKQKNIMYPRAQCLLKLDRSDEALLLCNEMLDLFQLTKARNLKAQILGELGGAKRTDPEDPLIFDDPGTGPADLAEGSGRPAEEASDNAWGRTILVTAIVLASLAAGYYWLFTGGAG
ncbi:MAG: tetratricopeptide repeat protein [Candidatus Hydrogenedentes bacterium]|nr:tetratricopeptide repeat protein [Candidatus Hydrogenedentota bacterium]